MQVHFRTDVDVLIDIHVDAGVDLCFFLVTCSLTDSIQVDVKNSGTLIYVVPPVC